MNRERYTLMFTILKVLWNYCFVLLLLSMVCLCVCVCFMCTSAPQTGSHIYAVSMIQYVNVTFSIWFHLQGFCVCGSRQPDPSSEVSCFPLWLTCQEHSHQLAWDVFKGQPLLDLILCHYIFKAVSWFIVNHGVLTWIFIINFFP